jgi:hypothetical protein
LITAEARPEVPDRVSVRGVAQRGRALRRPELRSRPVEESVYVVKACPGSADDIVGIHLGDVAWQGIRRRLPGGVYVPGRDRVAQLTTIEAAEAFYRSRLVPAEGPEEPRYFTWRLETGSTEPTYSVR